jgi:response regulator RpfG family c-di-GMP phosphodiesterase
MPDLAAITPPKGKGIMAARIVVIDDAVDLVLLYEEMMVTSADYELVGTFHWPPSDANHVAVLHPDLIILSWLFGRDALGKEVLEMLKTSPLTAAIPVIVTTAAPDALEAAKGLLTQHGVRVVHHPFAMDTLVAVIEQALTAAKTAMTSPDGAGATEPRER